MGNPGKTHVTSSGVQNITRIYDQVSMNEQGDVAMAAVTSLGEAVFVDLEGKIQARQCAKNPVLNPCIFEYVY